MEYGLRAAFLILRRYIRRYKKNTISSIVSTWAPSSENNTIKYIDRVAQMTHLSPDEPIDYYDRDTMCKLVAAMAQVECGKPIDEAKIIKAYDMA
jgi:hypothetical protein